jgi:hypothetical protein
MPDIALRKKKQVTSLYREVSGNWCSYAIGGALLFFDVATSGDWQTAVVCMPKHTNKLAWTQLDGFFWVQHQPNLMQRFAPVDSIPLCLPPMLHRVWYYIPYASLLCFTSQMIGMGVW